MAKILKAENIQTDLIGSHGDAAFSLQRNSSSLLTLSTTDRVGIGTTFPGYRLTVQQSSGTDSQIGLVTTSQAINTGSKLQMDLTNASNQQFEGGNIQVRHTSSNQTAGAENCYMAFSTRNAGTIGERLRIDSSGNVGIGTSSPSTRLHVNSGSSDQYARFNSSHANGGYLTFESSGTVHGDIGTAAQVVSGGSASDFGINARGSRNLILGTSNTERLRIDSSGNVGIGGSSIADTRVNIETDSANQQYIDVLKLKTTNTGDIHPSILFESNRASNSRKAKIALDGTSSANSGDLTYLAQNLHVFRTGGITGAGSTLGMAINSSGNVGIGTSAPTAQLELSTDSAKKPSTNTWTIASDERLKTNITPADLDRCYEITKTVPLKRYTWRTEVYSLSAVRDRSKLGWIAQDVEAVFPKAVGTNRFAYNQIYEDIVTPEVDTDGNPVLDEEGVQKTKTEKRLVSEDVIEDCRDLNADQIYAVMYGTIQKLIAKVETLEAKVAALEAA
jgi:hypothetical protein